MPSDSNGLKVSASTNPNTAWSRRRDCQKWAELWTRLECLGLCWTRQWRWKVAGSEVILEHFVAGKQRPATCSRLRCKCRKSRQKARLKPPSTPKAKWMLWTKIWLNICKKYSPTEYASLKSCWTLNLWANFIYRLKWACPWSSNTEMHTPRHNACLFDLFLFIENGSVKIFQTSDQRSGKTASNCAQPVWLTFWLQKIWL